MHCCSMKPVGLSYSSSIFAKGWVVVIVLLITKPKRWLIIKLRNNTKQKKPFRLNCMKECKASGDCVIRTLQPLGLVSPIKGKKWSCGWRYPYLCVSSLGRQTPGNKQVGRGVWNVQNAIACLIDWLIDRLTDRYIYRTSDEFADETFFYLQQ